MERLKEWWSSATTKKRVLAVFVLFVVLGLLANAASAACWKRDHVAAFLEQEHGLALMAWGLNDAGDMEELFFDADTGHWAVIVTSPRGCSTVNMPHKLSGRLSKPQFGTGPVSRIPNRLHDGEPM